MTRVIFQIGYLFLFETKSRSLWFPFDSRLHQRQFESEHTLINEVNIVLVQRL